MRFSLLFPRLFAPLLLLCLTLTAPGLQAEELRDPYSHFFSDTFGDFSEELESARAEGKKGILLFFEMDECPFCHFMKGEVLNRPEVQAYFREHFLNFAVDIEGDLEITDFEGNPTTQKAFAKKNRVRATPVIAFFDLEGKRIHRHTGRTADIAEFLLLGRYIVDDHYLTERFTRFKRSQREAG